MENWLRRLKKFFSLSFSDKLLLLNAFFVVASIRLALKVFSFPRFKNVYSSAIATNDQIDVKDEAIKQNVWAIESVSYTLSAVCLPQALALKYMLRKDKATEIVIGVRKNEKFEAHAWVKKNGKILIGDSPATNQQPLDFQPLWKWQ
jgi:hypothetical protein